MKLILTLSHGNASVERGFSVRNSSLTMNQSVETMTAQHFVIDHMQSNNLKPTSIELPSKMLLAVKCAYRKHAEAKEAKNKMTELSAQQNQYKILANDIADIKSKIEGFQKSCNVLDAVFESAIQFQAENQSENSMTIIYK